MSECSASILFHFKRILRSGWQRKTFFLFFFNTGFDAGEVKLTVQLQGPFANDFWAAPNWVLNVCNIHKQLYTVQLGRQRCTGLSDRFAWLSTWDPEDDEGDGSPTRERMCTMDDFHYSITALHSHTHPITAWINWSSYLFFPLHQNQLPVWRFSPLHTTNTTHCLLLASFPASLYLILSHIYTHALKKRKEKRRFECKVQCWEMGFAICLIYMLRYQNSQSPSPQRVASTHPRHYSEIVDLLMWCAVRLRGKRGRFIGPILIHHCEDNHFQDHIHWE